MDAAKKVKSALGHVAGGALGQFDPERLSIRNSNNRTEIMGCVPATTTKRPTLSLNKHARVLCRLMDSNTVRG